MSRTFGDDRLDIVKAVIEGALHADVTMQVDGARMKPTHILEALLNVPRVRMRADPSKEIGIVIERLTGRPPNKVVEDVHRVIVDWLGKALAATPDEGGSGVKLKQRLIWGIRSALDWGMAVRTGLPQQMYWDPWLGRHLWSATPKADPYDFLAPVVVEVANGWFLPKGYAEKHGFLPIAGPVATGRTMLAAAPYMWLHPETVAARNGPCVDLAVWSPRRASTNTDVLEYLNLPSLVRELMYWRGLVFGPGAISPQTFSSTTLAVSYERGQRLRGPQMTAPPPGPMDPKSLRRLVRKASKKGNAAVTDLLVHAQYTSSGTKT